MNGAILVVRCLLAAVFATAALGKLRDRDGSRQALEDFGVPAGFAPAGVVVLPVVELVVAVMLLLRPAATAGAVGAVILLVAFMAGIARAMSQGRAPDCHCFGQIHSEPAGPWTLARNGLLAALAGFVAVTGPGPTLDSALSNLSALAWALIVVAVVAVVLAIACASLWRRARNLEHDLRMLTGQGTPSGLPVGTVAPEFELPAVRGTARSVADLIAGDRPAVLVFVSTTCGPCLQMLPTLARWQSVLGQSLSVVAVFQGEATEIERQAEAHDLSSVLAQENDEVFRRYDLRATPSAVHVDERGHIAAGAAEGIAAIEALVRTVLDRGPARIAVTQSP